MTQVIFLNAMQSQLQTTGHYSLMVVRNKWDLLNFYLIHKNDDYDKIGSQLNKCIVTLKLHLFYHINVI